MFLLEDGGRRRGLLYNRRRSFELPDRRVHTRRRTDGGGPVAAAGDAGPDGGTAISQDGRSPGNSAARAAAAVRGVCAAFESGGRTRCSPAAGHAAADDAARGGRGRARPHGSISDHGATGLRSDRGDGQHGESDSSLGCIGNRVYTELPDGEFYLAVPGGRWANWWSHWGRLRTPTRSSRSSTGRGAPAETRGYGIAAIQRRCRAGSSYRCVDERACRRIGRPRASVV